MDAVALGWVATGFTLAVAVFLVPFGRAADIHGRKRIFTIRMIAFAATSAVMRTSRFGLDADRVSRFQGIASP